MRSTAWKERHPHKEGDIELKPCRHRITKRKKENSPGGNENMIEDIAKDNPDYEIQLDGGKGGYITAEQWVDVNNALKNPSQNIQNIYFGLIMGISAMLPTMVHFIMFLKSSFHVIIGNSKRSIGK